jgi:hypothetical protein
MSELDDRDLAERVAAPLRAQETVDAAFETRVLAAARAAVARGEAPWQSTPNVVPLRPARSSWLARSYRSTVSPLGRLAAAAVFAAVIVGTTLVISRRRPNVSAHDTTARAGTTPEVVRFVIAAPSAHDVALVGDFNGWNPTATPLRRESAGSVWMVTMPLAAGTYQYAFVVDGRAWVADPSGVIALEDEFGTPSSLLTVSGRRT